MAALDDAPNEDDENLDDQSDDAEDDQEIDDDSDDDGEDAGANDDGDLVITIGDDDEDGDTKHQKDDSALLHDLRNRLREQNKELKVFRSKEPAPKPDIVLGEKPARPTLDDADHDPDKHTELLDKWEEDVTQWNADKVTVADQDEKKKAAIDKADDDHKASLKVYNTQKVDLKVADDDFTSAQNNVIDVLSDDQQGLILAGADNPAKVVFGLGTNPAALKKLAAITNPAKFAVALGKLEMTIKTQRKGPPPPEGRLEGSNARLSGSGNKALERARKKAEKTGDRTEVVRLMREQRQQKRAG